MSEIVKVKILEKGTDCKEVSETPETARRFKIELESSPIHSKMWVGSGWAYNLNKIRGGIVGSIHQAEVINETTVKII